ncbi:MAG TPA: tetratricopeptide repeat protein [Stellaceae bacterium]|nr:tetratricopeptide repeat protein [Stellaceae bacterium]
MDQADYAPPMARLAAAKCVRSVEALLSLGRTAEASAVLEDGLERFPDHTELAQLQQRIERITALGPASLERDVDPMGMASISISSLSAFFNAA